MPHQVFVYGTLKRGHSRASLLCGQRLLGPAWSAPRYRLFSLGSWPALVEAERPDVEGPGVSVYGEVWSVDAACLARLDWEEDVDEGLYERRSIELLAWDVQRYGPAEAYFYCGKVRGLGDCGTCW
ncbi:MAG: gamma-glutamylcyclotransferase family protein [Phycisphaeraceae bacterium]